MTLPKGFKKHTKVEYAGPFSPPITEEEILCPHGVGHGKGIHGCDGCCSKLKDEKAPGYKNRMMTSTGKKL